MSYALLFSLGFTFLFNAALAGPQKNTCDRADTCELETGRFSFAEADELRKQLRPLFHLDFDYGSYVVNLTPQIRSPSKDAKPEKTPTLVYGDFRNGFQKTVFGQLQIGFGSQMRFWFDNIPGMAKEHWSYVGVTPQVGFETESVRYALTLQKAQALGGRWRVPAQASDLNVWDVGDSIAFTGRGGVLFSAAVGSGPVGVGAAKLAMGTWETFVEKVANDRVYVKSTLGKLKNFSLFLDGTLINLKLQQFQFADDGFSFLFDLTTEIGRRSYEDMIRGNIIAAERWTDEKPANFVERVPVQKVETFRTVTTGKMVSKNFSIPLIWDQTYSIGRVQVFNTSEMHIGRNTTRVHYGIFSENKKNQFWQRRREVDFMFYGAHYDVKNWDTQAQLKSFFGTYSYSFKQEDSNRLRLTAGIQGLLKKTGLEVLRVNVPDKQLSYTGLEFNVNFEEANTLRMVALAQQLSLDQFIDLSTDQIHAYFHQKKDPYGYCPGGVSSFCVNKVVRQTAEAASLMYFSLRKMNQLRNTDSKAFSAAYGRFGEGMAENLFTFTAAIRAAGEGTRVDYLLEGTYISMFLRSWIVDSRGQLVLDPWPIYKGSAFQPAQRHSRLRGLLVGREESGSLPQMKRVSF